MFFVSTRSCSPSLPNGPSSTKKKTPDGSDRISIPSRCPPYSMLSLLCHHAFLPCSCGPLLFHPSYFGTLFRTGLPPIPMPSVKTIFDSLKTQPRDDKQAVPHQVAQAGKAGQGQHPRDCVLPRLIRTSPTSRVLPQPCQPDGARD
jgi:hypothetical protein